jgi:acetyl esterase/lipase
MKNKLFYLICLVFTIGTFAQEITTYKAVDFPKSFSSQIDVIYTKVGNWEGRADFYFNKTATKPTPAVINIHGGGWNKGVKESQTAYNTFFKAGFAVANMEYRLSQQGTAPAAVEDTRCMLIYLIQHAKELNIDPNKIVIMGGSAGGHLALMGGLLANDTTFDTNCIGTKNIKVAAIIDKYGITDLYDWSFGKLKSKSALQWLGDKVTDKKFIESVSPITLVNKNSPPTFIVHGNADPIVPYQQSVDLYKKFQEMGVKSQFITVEGGLHGNFENEKNTEINQAIIQFLTEINIIN